MEKIEETKTTLEHISAMKQTAEETKHVMDHVVDKVDDVIKELMALRKENAELKAYIQKNNLECCCVYQCKITYENKEHVYIGSTSNFEARIALHKSNAALMKNGNKFIQLFNKVLNNAAQYSFTILTVYHNISRKELKAFEQEHIDNMKSNDKIEVMNTYNVVKVKKQKLKAT